VSAIERPPSKKQQSKDFVHPWVPGTDAWGGNWQDWANDAERVPELRWPRSRLTFEQMRVDAQIDALWQGTTLPILRYRWFLDPNGAPARLVKAAHEDTGLPILDAPKIDIPRSRDRFVWRDHLRLALLSKLYGYAYFEQLGEIRGGMWRLRKLAYVHPRTITDLKVTEQGTLEWIGQEAGIFTANDPSGIRRLPINRLVGYVNDKEGANWLGRSMLRSVYKNWLLKDRLLRLDVLRHERNSMGVPIVTLPTRASKQQIEAAQKIASGYKAGEFSGGTLTDGMDLTLKGVEGTVSDVLASIRYHDEQTARKFLQMFAQLGTTSYGSRALSEGFIDFFSLSQMSLAEDIRDTFNQHMMEDYTDWNSGPNANAPMVGFERDEDPDLAVADLVALFDKGILTLDDETEGWIRKRWNLPQRDPSSPPRTVAPTETEPDPSSNGSPSTASGRVGLDRVPPDDVTVRASSLRAPSNGRRAPRRPTRHHA
jgi:hypothetical protein